MKRFIQWLAKVFNADITITKVIEKQVEKEVIKKVYIPKDGIIKGNITIEGDVLIYGELKVTGELTIKNK